MDAGDALLGLAAFAVSLKGFLRGVSWPVAGMIVGFATLPVAVRRRLPLPVLASITVANCASLGFGADHITVAGPLCQAVTIYSVARHRRPRLALAAAGAALLALTLGLVVTIAVTRAAFPNLVPLALVVGVLAAAIGAGLRMRETYLRQRQDRAESLERERKA